VTESDNELSLGTSQVDLVKYKICYIKSFSLRLNTYFGFTYLSESGF